MSGRVSRPPQFFLTQLPGCEIEAADLAMLLGNWGPCPGPCTPGEPDETCPADLDGDCEVEAFDLAILLGAWGSCP